MERTQLRHPNWSVLIADGAATYPAAFCRLGIATTVILHFHSHPWNSVKVSVFEPRERSIQVLQVQVPYDFFLRDDSVEILTRNSTGQYRKKKGAKRKQVKKTKKKQPRKKAESNIFSLSSKSKAVSLYSRQEPTPNVFAVPNVIKLLVAIFGNGTIQSNLIESVNSQVKHVIRTQGLKTKGHLQYWLAFFLGILGLTLLKPERCILFGANMLYLDYFGVQSNDNFQ